MRESNFEYQSKEILLSALKGYNIENLDDVEEFQEEVWKDKYILQELGRQFIERLNNYSGDDVFQEVMEELEDEEE